MATTSLSAGTFTSFANVSTTSSPGSCGPCTSVQIYDLWRGSWTQNTSLPAIRTIQPILDPVHNTTTTSVICNTAALSAYDQCDRMSLNDNCDIVCEDRNGRPESEDPYTITLTSTGGNYIQFASTFRIQGGVSTTDSNGAYTCLNESATLDQTSYTYAGPTSVTLTGMNLLIMSELTDAYPGVALFEQCTWFQTGPPPIALTPANQIVLPVMTMAGPSTTKTQSPTTSATTPTTSARPADTGAGTTPTRTSQPQTTSTDTPASPEGSEDPSPPPQTDQPGDSDDEPTTTSAPGGGSNLPPSETQPVEEPADEPADEPATSATQGSPNPPAQSDDSEEQNDGSDNPPTIVVPTLGNNNSPSTAAQPGNSGTNTRPEAEDNGPDTPITAAQPGSPGSNTGSQAGDDVPIIPATTAAPAISTIPTAIVPGVTLQDGNGSPEIVVGGSTTIGAGEGVAVGSGTTFSVLPSAGGVIAVAGGSTNTLPLPAPITSAGDAFVRPLTTSAQAIAIPGATISAGGAVVAVSGTTFSALPSNAGVVAISVGGSTTVAESQLATLGVSTVSGVPGAFVLPDQTLTAEGSAVVVSGTTYSALPQGSGIQVLASGQTSVIPVSEATSIPGIGEASVTDVTGGYVLAGSITVQPGSPAATISGVVYSALPSGLGVLVTNSTDDFASYIEQGISGSDSNEDGDEPYIIGSDSSLTAGGDAITVSGVVYSALPSGSGVLVIASGRSTTIGLTSTASASRSGKTQAPTTSETGNSGAEESVVPSTSAADPGAGRSTWSNAFVTVGLIAAAIVL